MSTNYLNLPAHGGLRFGGEGARDAQTHLWIRHLQARLKKAIDEEDPLQRQARRGQERLLHALNVAQAKHRKRPARALRRANPRNLRKVEQALRAVCLQEAAARNFSGSLVFNKAQMASALNIPEHFIAQVAQLWNRKGLCGQAVNRAPHDSHRDPSWVNFWTSAWRDTTYEVDLDKLLHQWR